MLVERVEEIKNKEKYAKEIIDVACSGDSIAVTKGSEHIVRCSDIACSECLFACLNCEEKIREWVEQEYIEKPVISKRDKAFLDYIKEGYKFVARDKNGKLFVYGSKPYKDKTCKCWWGNDWCRDSDSPTLPLNYNVDFPMVKGEDSEPWLIEDLKKLGVVDEYE